MEPRVKRHELFETAHLMILICYTIMSVILIGEGLLLGWEGWALILILISVGISWFLHIMQIFSKDARLWIYSVLMMVTAFFYGIHLTSAYDLGLVICGVMILYTMTGVTKFIVLWQTTYFAAFGYDLVCMARQGVHFDKLVITRTLFHMMVILVVGRLAKTIIKKWTQVMEESQSEIAALKEATDRINDFLVNISHEIRTPINAVIGLTGVCLEKEQDDEIRKNLTAVSEAGKRVGEQVSDILDYSEIDMDDLAVNTEDYMLSSLLNDLVAELVMHKNPEIELVIDVDPAIPSVMHTDVVKLKKIFRHLIDNGLKYTKEGGVYVHITSVPREYGINLCVEVTDTGIGMNEKEMEMVFERFYQADSGRTRATNGLGLGLSIVNGFVSSLKGFLTLESAPDQGTTVRVSIPQKVVDSQNCMSLESPEKLVLGGFLHFDKFENPHVRVFYNAMVKNIVTGLNVSMHRVDNMEGLRSLTEGMQFTHLFIGKEEYEENRAFVEELAKTTLVALVAEGTYELPEDSNVRLMRKPFYCFPVISFLESSVHEIKQSEERIVLKNVRALVVDDEPMNLMVAKGIFSRYGMIVTKAISGWEAIELCRENEFDIVFMDHMMPGMDGIEAMKRLRTEFNRSHKDIPIVALTANAVSTAKEMFLREGFDGFVSKPIELTELERVLRKVLPKTMFVQRDTITKVLPEKEGKKKKGKKQTLFQALKKLGVDTDTGLNYCQNDKEFYRSLLLQYGSDAPEKRKNAKSCLEQQDYENYAIIVHALKSTSKMIGALALSEKAKQLENAAKERNLAALNDWHEDAMREYRKITGTILKYLGKKPSPKKEKRPEEELSSLEDQEMIFEFEPEGEEEILEFEPEPDSDILEFEPESESEVMEFEPEGGEGI